MNEQPKVKINRNGTVTMTMSASDAHHALCAVHQHHSKEWNWWHDHYRDAKPCKEHLTMADRFYTLASMVFDHLQMRRAHS